MTRILIAGDFCQKYRVDVLIKEKQFEALFGNIKSVIESVDYSIVNFEFPIVVSPSSGNPIPKCGPNLKGTIEAVEAIKYAGFKCCTLANNHILDQGEVCCIDTRDELDKSNIDTVGIGINLQEAKKTLYLQKNGQKLAVINCCEHEFSIATETGAGANPLNPIQQYYAIKEAKAKADYVLVIVHGGHEYYQLPSLRMQETYRFFIDAGADAVVNHHQHCFSGYEVYKGKPIFYGLGNFCFDNPSKRNNIWNEGYMVMIEFGKDNIDYEIIPYEQCNEQPGIHLLSRDAYSKRIEELNAVIADRKKLKEAADDYYSKTADSMRRVFQPYENRILNKLYRTHLLPSLVSIRKYLMLQNYIDCEAHRDKVLFALKRIIKQ